MSFRKRALVAMVAAAFAGLAAAPSFASVSFTGTSGDLSAQAMFSISGNDLTITLTNIATVAPGASNGGLTGLFFNFTGTNPGLSPTSATVTAGTIIQASLCNVGANCDTATNVGGEFIFGAGPFSDSGGSLNAEFGISSSGYIGGPAGNFNGPNLDDPNAPDGANFAIVPTSFTSGSANGGLDNDPLIRNSVVFVLSGVSGFSESAISNVSFQYGTNLGEPNVPSTSSGPPSSSTSSGPPSAAPEPGTSTLALLGTALIAGALRQRRKARAA